MGPSPILSVIYGLKNVTCKQTFLLCPSDCFVLLGIVFFQIVQ